MPHGGRREGSGRRKDESVKIEQAIEKPGFCLTVFGRIGEGPPAKINSPEDYLLDLLYSQDVQTRSYNFNRCLDRIYGKPAQAVFSGDTREQTREMSFGGLPLPVDFADKAKGKPN